MQQCGTSKFFFAIISNKLVLNFVKIRGKTTNHIALQNRLKPVGWALLFAWQVPLSRLRG